MSKSIRILLVFCAMPALLLSACGSTDPSAGVAPKDCNYANTYDAIQATIFEAKGCTESTCHGEGIEGGLDLRVDASFDALVRHPSNIDPSIDRVFPGDQDLSVLYQKLAAATEDKDLGALGQPMPVGGEALSADQLEAMRLWIRAGAPSDSIVGGTLELLGCDGSFEPEPNKINPLPSPAPDEGVQFYAGGWDLAAEAEDEVCFATYYDFSAQVPPEFQVDCEQFGAGRKCFAFRRNELAQDGQSHHSIINVYTPDSDPRGGAWGPWTCLGGEKAGQTCTPGANDECGSRSQCTTPVESAVACVGYDHAPIDFGLGGGAMGGGTDSLVPLSGAQESTAIDLPPPGVYSILPLRGFVSWNSHGFNLTTSGTSIEQWVNLSFAPEQEREWVRRQIFEADNIFAMTKVEPFKKREVCMTWTLPRYSQLMSLSSHMHVRGELFRIWLPPNTPCEGTRDCGPPNTAADYESRLYDDPLYTYYDPPNDYSSDAVEERTLKACAVYDNGEDNPLEVKRESTKPNTPSCDFFFASCGCAASDRACLGGDQEGTPCDGDDSVCGEGGLCDACPLLGGVTTDDEMFIPLGSFFVQEPSP
jgi:hypothetical protein